MTRITDFNQIDDCDKIDAAMINAFVDFHFDRDNETGICLESSWGGDCLDLKEIIKKAETCTELHLSPGDNPNCLVYNGECEDFCIDGDDLSRIISMKFLKDVDQTTPPTDGDVYIYDNGVWKTFNLQTFMDNIGTSLANLNAQISNFDNRVTNIENKLTPPADAPSNANVVFGNVNIYSDHNAVIDGNGNVVTLNKNNGLYSHVLSEERNEDEIFG